MNLNTSPRITVPLHELPRDIRIWLCTQIGWKEPVHFGIVHLFAKSSTAKELHERIQAHKALVKTIGR